MSVIAAVISRYWTAHASDSLITLLRNGGTREPIEWEKSKIVAVPKLRGALAFWGLAEYEAYGWSTLNWLQAKAQQASNFLIAEDFAQMLADELNNKISQMSFARPTDSGIGIHLSIYERVGDHWIPELLRISNWQDETYNAIRSSGVGFSRETFHAISGETPNPRHGVDECRLQVFDRLREGVLIQFNNGDPLMFNASANAIMSMLGELSKRRILLTPETWQTNAALARRPIEVISQIQRDFCLPGTRLVGGRLHDLAISPLGEYFSTSGDC